MKYFTEEQSIVRQIWGKADSILFIFAGAAAEFAVNKAVDWLYFTGKLPADPLGRLFSTVVYARQIIFSEMEDANRALEKITAIHQGVEKARGAQIPDWAYRDVLFMLIDYSIRSFEILYRKLSDAEKLEIFDVFYRVGAGMKIKDLPQNYADWQLIREAQMDADMINSDFTIDLYEQYRKHLGPVRYLILKQVQVLLVPKQVNQLLSLGNTPYLLPWLLAYKASRAVKLDEALIFSVLPDEYREQVKNLSAGE